MDIGGSQAQHAPFQGGIEGPGVKHSAELAENLGEAWLKRLGPGRQNVAAWGPDQKGISLEISKSGQGPAHGGLAEAEFGRRVGDVTPPQQGFKRGNELEIEAGDMRTLHVFDTTHAFFGYQAKP